ncbi:hypothetical protein ACWGCI_30785 [Streptomyces sp. NPDC054949]|uniref:hypothetical protein n=1 Tax=Streptomyces sp. NBC_00291 TaxID=2975704 RepID=UPI0022524FF7|nr:hypothetical protein [Streptomyces sp. NBC_00291]MCX5157525.1 hypothetical protein [Streptomyces sp. NBC_00291]
MNVPAGGRPYEIHEDGPGSMILASLLAGALGVGTFWAWTPWEQESLFATVFFWGWAVLCLLFGAVGLVFSVRALFVPAFRADGEGVRFGRFRASWPEIREIVVGTVTIHVTNWEDMRKSGDKQRRVVWVVLNTDLQYEFQHPMTDEQPALDDMRRALAAHAGGTPVSRSDTVVRRTTWQR